MFRSMIQQIRQGRVEYLLKNIQGIQMSVLQSELLLRLKLDSGQSVFLILICLVDLRSRNFSCRDLVVGYLRMVEDRGWGLEDLDWVNSDQDKQGSYKVEGQDWGYSQDWGCYKGLDWHCQGKDYCKDQGPNEMAACNHQSYKDWGIDDCLNDCFEDQRKALAQDDFFYEQKLQDIKIDSSEIMGKTYYSLKPMISPILFIDQCYLFTLSYIIKAENFKMGSMEDNSSNFIGFQVYFHILFEDSASKFV